MVIYQGQPVGEDGVFFQNESLTRHLDFSCGTWYYGHDDRNGQIVPWLRLRENPDRDNNMIHQMTFKEDTWQST